LVLGAFLETLRHSAQPSLVTSPTLWLLAVALLLTSCSQRDQDAKARALAETNRHIESGADLVTRLSKLTEFTPPYEIAATLRRFTYDTQEWHRAYTAQRAKLMTRGLSRDQSAELTRRYKTIVEELKTKVEQTDRRLSKRSDTKLYYAELLRMREAIRQL
jgi:1,2-phenylacetyl-CoA epoxidase catalytic subunit